MHKAFKFRLYPTKEQEKLIIKNFGCCRFVFNHFLEKWNETYEQTGKGLSYNTCAKQLTQLKKELEWLKEADATALQNALKHLDEAFKRFFKKQNDHPRFKSKKNPVQSYTSQCVYSSTKPTIEVAENKIKLPKLGWVRLDSLLKSIEKDILKHWILYNCLYLETMRRVCMSKITKIRKAPTKQREICFRFLPNNVWGSATLIHTYFLLS